jgi:MYXO-CTERM domain-containing protein
LTAFAHDGAPRWQAYGDASEDTLCARHDDPASTRGVAVVRGGDGLVYLLAEVEGRDDLFRSRPDDLDLEANNVVFDVYTDPETARPRQSAYYARFTAGGGTSCGQYFLLPATGAVVRPRAISADVHGNVVSRRRRQSQPRRRRRGSRPPRRSTAWPVFIRSSSPTSRPVACGRLLDADDMHTDLVALAASGDRVVSLLEAAAADGQAEGSLPTGPSVLLWPGGFGPVAVEKRPDPETQGTFGYESGISGSDPTCYCDTSPPAPAALLALSMFTLAGLRRPRRCD